MEKRKEHPRILTDRTIRTILCLGYAGETNTCALAKDVGITTSHAYQEIMPKLISWGCVEIDEKVGRLRAVRLTPKGEQIFKRLQEIGELLGEPINETGDRRLDLVVY